MTLRGPTGRGSPGPTKFGCRAGRVPASTLHAQKGSARVIHSTSASCTTLKNRQKIRLSGLWWGADTPHVIPDCYGRSSPLSIAVSLTRGSGKKKGNICFSPVPVLALRLPPQEALGKIISPGPLASDPRNHGIKHSVLVDTPLSPLVFALRFV